MSMSTTFRLAALTAAMLATFSQPMLAQHGLGGMQDIGFSRQLIMAGQVPNVSNFSMEGMFREHDITPPVGNCDARVCMSLGYGMMPTADTVSGHNSLFVSLHVDSQFEPEGFKRAPQQLALVIDKSGSMNGGSMEAVKTALRSLARQLRPEDEFILVEFDNRANLVLPATLATDTTAIMVAINQLQPGGGTNIEAGLRLGFRELAALPTRPGVDKRLMLFTDAMPNIGETDSGSFRDLTARYSREGIGMTAFGVGIEFGQELVTHISQLPGGSAYYLNSSERIATVFDQEFAHLVTPLAYNVSVQIPTPKGMQLAQVYGLPTWKPGDQDAVLTIPSIFLSTRRSAILLRYQADATTLANIAEGDTITTAMVDYKNPDGSIYHKVTTLLHTDKAPLGSREYYSHDGMRLAAALGNIWMGLRSGCERWANGDRAGAVASIDRADSIANSINSTMNNTGVTDELKLLQALRTNITGGIASRNRP